MKNTFTTCFAFAWLSWEFEVWQLVTGIEAGEYDAQVCRTLLEQNVM